MVTTGTWMVPVPVVTTYYSLLLLAYYLLLYSTILLLYFCDCGGGYKGVLIKSNDYENNNAKGEIKKSEGKKSRWMMDDG
jgi:hypothetical protein